MKTIDQRVMELEQMADLEHAKAVQIQNGNQAGYVEILNILQRNIF